MKRNLLELLAHVDSLEAVSYSQGLCAQTLSSVKAYSFDFGRYAKDFILALALSKSAAYIGQSLSMCVSNTLRLLLTH